MSVNPLQKSTTLARDPAPATEAAPPSEAEEQGLNRYGKFADIYDVFGSEEFCLAMTTHLVNAADRYSLEDGARCLDLACGTGVITVELARFGFSMTGVDLSADMLRHARERASTAQLPITFHQKDMRDFVLSEPVRWIICTHDSLDHLVETDDLSRAFGQVSAALAEGGFFMFDMNCWEGIRHLDGKTVFVEVEDRSAAYYLVAANHTLRTNIVGFIKREGNLYERFDEVLFQRCYTNEEITRCLNQNGLVVREHIPVQHNKGDVFKQLWICQVPGPEVPLGVV